MSRYYAGSRPFKYLRGLFGITKPVAAQWGEWDDWKKNTKREHPIGYWLTEDLPSGLDRTMDFITKPFREARCYYRNRFRDRMHLLPTRLPPGKYYDLDTRLLHAIMESIVDYVEIELAAQTYWNEPKKYVRKGLRCPQAGLDHLAWEMSLDDETVQPERAAEVLALYKWWKHERPNRPDAGDASGYNAYLDRRDAEGHDMMDFLDERIPRSEEEMAEARSYMDKSNEIETQYLKEDEEMLIRVMKIRPHLWT